MMKRRMRKYIISALALMLMAAALCGCAAEPAPPLEGTADNDILTFADNSQNKPIIRIAMQHHIPDDFLITTLQAQFPDYLFVEDYTASAGTKSIKNLQNLLDAEEPMDLIITGLPELPAAECERLFVNLSAESLLNDYLLSSLNSISLNGNIYFLPGVSTMAGIAYNADMFAQHGWQIPTNTDEFFALCETIEAEGITPFSTCFKYQSQINRLLGCMCYDQLYMTPQDAAWLQEVQNGRASFTGHMEPAYELAQRFYDTGVITLDSFTASLTQQRNAFWDGEYAMIDYKGEIYTYGDAEGADFEVGFMPYPTGDSQYSGYYTLPNYYLALPKTLEADPERLAFMKEVLAFLSSAEGQQAIIRDSLSLSNVKGVELSPDNPALKYVIDAYQKGNIYPEITYIKGYSEGIRSIFEGGSVADALAITDEIIMHSSATAEPQAQYETLATAETDFTVLETSYYIADKLKAAAGTDIGLMINHSFFVSNLAAISAGDITSNLDLFVMKGVDAQDCLTTYRLTGAQLRELMEHPMVNDVEIDALIAASGLAVKYAPWNERGSRVIELTLEDGTELRDDELYTVAAWNGAIADEYITDTVEVHDELGALTDILAAALREDKSIAPDIAGRVTLIWPEAE
ncbi:MAG: extracellular solute-binding protein [Syntrophomonadaceae bacterium]|nr:extracellular solute-binding protein [Syntrophomonadaceae bacterium]